MRVRSESGIVAVFDAIMFLIIVLVLVGGLVAASLLIAKQAPAARDEALLAYADDTLRAFLDSTVVEASYQDPNGDWMRHPPINPAIGFLVAEDLAQRDEGLAPTNMASMEAEMDGITAETIVERALQGVRVPKPVA